jgi:hypothetical protein
MGMSDGFIEMGGVIKCYYDPDPQDIERTAAFYREALGIPKAFRM